MQSNVMRVHLAIRAASAPNGAAAGAEAGAGAGALPSPDVAIPKPGELAAEAKLVLNELAAAVGLAANVQPPPGATLLREGAAWGAEMLLGIASLLTSSGAAVGAIVPPVCSRHSALRGVLVTSMQAYAAFAGSTSDMQQSAMTRQRQQLAGHVNACRH